MASEPSFPGEARRSWNLTSRALDRLLCALEPDRDKAAVAYEELRQRLIGLFRWWGAVDAEDLADETLDRVARKLEEGAPVERTAVGAYVRGVARMIFYEASRKPKMVNDVPDRAFARNDAVNEPVLTALDRSLDRLSAADRTLVLRYYGEGKAADVRRALAADLGISPAALRLRAHRVRDYLERQVRATLPGA